MLKPSLDPLRANSRYQKREDLSNGAFGFVQLAEDTQTGHLVAVKFLERLDCGNRYVETEILNHRHLRHPHVVEFKEVFLTAEHIGIVMEYAAGGTLLGYLQRHGPLQEHVARWFFQQLIIALDFCHRKGVVNRDIKLENTLLLNVPGVSLPLLKLCDFGYSKATHMSAPKSRVGTLAYMAPEIVRSAAPYDGRKADVWSAAVMLYAMLVGSYPFDVPASAGELGGHAARLNTMMERILAGHWTLPPDVAVSEDCRTFLAAMLSPDPLARPSIQEVMRHPWFLVNLPPRALAMNDTFLGVAEPPGLQSVDAIRKLLREAQELAQEEQALLLPSLPSEPLEASWPAEWNGQPTEAVALAAADSDNPAIDSSDSTTTSLPADLAPAIVGVAGSSKTSHHRRGASSGADSQASELGPPSATSSATVTRMSSRLGDVAACCLPSSSGANSPTSERRSQDGRA